MEFITFCVSVAALIIALNARSRSKMLENYLRDLRERGMTLSSAAAPAPSNASLLEAQAVQQRQAAPLQQQAVLQPAGAKPYSIGEWFKEDWLLKVGAILLLLGFGWFVSFAIANNWIGPMGRITMGLLAGAVLMVVGFIRYKTHPQQADIFLVLGAGVTILTTFAARSLYGYFTPLSALALMVVVSAFVAGASILYNRRPLATISLILIGLAPFLTASPTNDILGLFMYFGVLLVATAILSVLRDYPELSITAALFLWFYSLFALDMRGSGIRDTAFLIECFYAVVLFALQLIIATKTQGIRKIDTVAMLINSTLLLTWISTMFTRDSYVTPLFAWAALFLGGTYALFVMRTRSFTPEKGEYDGESAAVLAHGMIFLIAVFAMITPVWQSLTLAGWALLFVFAAYSAFLMTEKREGFFLYAAMAIVFIGAATAAELEGNALTIAYALEASAVTILAFLFTKDIAAARKASLLFAIPVFLSLITIGNPFSNSALAVMLTIGSILVSTGLYFRDLALATNSALNRQWYATLIVVGALYFLVTIWRVCTEMVFYGSFGVMVALIIYTVLGIGAYILGTHRDIKVYRLFGVWLVGFVIARLAIVDVWTLPSGVRIITFMVIGALMVSTAFIIRKKK